MKSSLSALAAAACLALGLTACSGNPAPNASTTAAPSTSATATTVETESNLGKHTITTPPTSVVALDNRTFSLLDKWDIPVKAGAVSLMRPDLKYKQDGTTDIGNHREPNLELIVAAEPDLVISGQRFTQFNEDIAKLVPNAMLVDYTPRDGEDFASELKRQVTEMGKIFGKESDADAMIADFDKAVERAKAAYDPKQKVLGVITSGGEINFAAPGKGRSVGPIFDMLGLTPALEVANSSKDHEGDNVSVEAIADANPDWILVMDREAAVKGLKGEDFTPAKDVIAGSAALQNVNAVKNQHIIYMPQFTYLDEGLATYTEFLNAIADAMEQAK